MHLCQTTCPITRFGTLSNGAVDLETIRGSYGRRVLAAFHAGTERRYPELFPKAAAEIELRSRAILQRLNTPPEASEPSIPPPETVKTRVWRIRTVFMFLPFCAAIVVKNTGGIVHFVL